MPLAFQSSSHALVAFGFFHIETDLLLLERRFFFAPDFCQAWLALAAAPGPEVSLKLPAWSLSPEQVGDLHGAISGRDSHGFIGALYQRLPFPRRREEFAQKPRGALPRHEVEKLLDGSGSGRDLELQASANPQVVRLASYAFSGPQWRALVDYVWQGGMPGWQQGRRPEYLLHCADILKQSGSPWFQGLAWDPRAIGFTS